MIKGIGIDIIEVSRVENAVNKSSRFLEKIFSSEEIKYIESRNHNSFTIAGLFSSKESVSKALGTGIRGFNWTDIEIYHDELGKPLVKLKENAKTIARQKGIENINLSISHIKDQAISISIAEGYVFEEKENIANVSEVKNILMNRSKDSHKGTYGRVGVIAGSEGMSGAPFLSSLSALRTGSGLVYTMVPDVISNILEIKSVEAIVKSFKDNGEGFSRTSIKDIIDYSKKLDIIALGPGLGVDDDRKELVCEILKNVSCPVVLDADGINCIANNKQVLKNRKSTTVITPHMMEFSRLTNVDVDELQNNREKYSMDFAKLYGVIVVLKGHNTVVCDGEKVYINSTGNPGMATAGSGDVLTGVIASLLGQGLKAFDAAKMGVYLHGLAGDMVKQEKGEHGIIASDIIEFIPLAIKQSI